jgi:Mg-chelatase subunit ChlD
MGNSLAQSTSGNLRELEGSMADYQRRTGAGLAKSWLAVKAVVVVDISGSMENRDAGDGHRRVDVAKMELAKLQKKLQGQIAVVEFNYDARWRRDGSLGEPTGGTNLAGALDYVRELVGPGLPRVQVVVVSDGSPDLEETALNSAKALAGAGAKVSAVYVGPDNHDAGKLFLKRLAGIGGGEAAEALLVKALEQQITKLLTAGPA